MSIDLIARVIIESQVGYGKLGIEFIIINEVDATYIGFAKARSLPTDEAWIIYRVKQDKQWQYTRLASNTNKNDYEEFNKILINYAYYNYIES